MDDFKSNTKMQCFKEGGSVQYKSRRSATMSESKDIAEDKKIVKKAIAMHDAQEHKGEKTDLSKLKKGGRSKKAVGTVKKYKTGGSVTNVYEAKKSSGDKDNIRKTKDIKPGKAEAPSRAAVKSKDFGAKTVGASGHKDPYIKSKESGKSASAPSAADSSKNSPAKFCGGKSVRKMANGGNLPAPTPMAQAGSQQAALLNALPGKASEIERAQMAARARNALKYLGPAQQSEFVNQGGMNPTPSIPAQKRGGKVKKDCK